MIGGLIKTVAQQVAKNPGKVAGGVATIGSALSYDSNSNPLDTLTARNEASSAAFRGGASDIWERISTGGKGETVLQNIGATAADVTSIASMPMAVAGNVVGTGIGALASAVSPYAQELAGSAAKQEAELHGIDTNADGSTTGKTEKVKDSVGTVIDAVKGAAEKADTAGVTEAVKATERATAWGAANELFGDISTAGANMLAMGSAAGTNVLGMGQTSAFSGSTAPSETPTQTSGTSAADVAKGQAQAKAAAAQEPVATQEPAATTGTEAGVTASNTSELTEHEQDLMEAAKGSGLSESVIRRELMKRRMEKYGSTDLPDND